MTATFGLHPDSIRHTDSGSKRSIADNMKMNGVKNYSCVSAICVTLNLYQNNLPFDGHILTYEEVDSVRESIDPDLMNTAAVITGKANKGSGVRPSLAGCFFLVFHEIDPDDAVDFFNRLADGVGFEPGSPILALRNRLREKEKRKTFLKREEAAFIIKAWNAFRTGRSITSLRFLDSEEFPIPQ